MDSSGRQASTAESAESFLRHDESGAPSSIQAAFKLWEKMHTFITKAVEVEEDDDYYKKEIQQFQVDVKQFYEYGRTIFLTSKSALEFSKLRLR